MIPEKGNGVILPPRKGTKEFWDLATQYLTTDELEILKVHMESGGYTLSPDTCASFFRLFLAGYDCYQISEENKPFSYGAILWARVQYKWDEFKDEYVMELQQNIKKKVITAQLETANMMADMLTVASQKFGDKLRKYIQTRDEEHLKGVMEVNSINGILKVVEGLQKITGQDRKTETKTVQEYNLNISSNETSTQTQNINENINNDGPISPESAAAILKVLASEKRKPDKK